MHTASRIFMSFNYIMISCVNATLSAINQRCVLKPEWWSDDMLCCCCCFHFPFTVFIPVDRHIGHGNSFLSLSLFTLCFLQRKTWSMIPSHPQLSQRLTSELTADGIPLPAAARGPGCWWGVSCLIKHLLIPLNSLFFYLYFLNMDLLLASNIDTCNDNQ